ncbi:unnamed protein product [Fraxinus pennsylvanica]|uniref:Uncharacterized protein n=1 Tax=Fraxinus pennsylvanica TaxID=56036 RepID=A0AAD2EDJ6_9LAMI|nr:unnamed protein product [Fraxinus pennsylvanica]
MANEFGPQTENQNQMNQADSPLDPSFAETMTGDVASIVNRLISDPSSPYYLHFGDITGMQLIYEERQREIINKGQHNIVDAAAFTSKLIPKYIGNRRINSLNQSHRREMLVRSYCRMLGHIKGKCYKLIGYPPGHRLAKDRNLVANVVSQTSRVSAYEITNSLSNVTITP